jgi:glucose-1-phosphate cytidylyltransferase
MKVIILAGGQGTRLREETEYRPKPLVDIGGRPILWHIMKHYAYYDFKEFVICLGYRGHMIKDYFLNYEAMNNDFTICLGARNKTTYHGNHQEKDYLVTLAETGLETMTGARVKLAEKYIAEEIFMVTYGDGVCDVDLQALLQFHLAHGRLATVTTVRPVSRFGILDIKSDGYVEEFLEKPQMEGWANAGYFVFNRKVFDYLSTNISCVLERDPLQMLARNGELMAYRHEGFFYAMDTYREYIYLNELWSSGKAPWAVWR